MSHLKRNAKYIWALEHVKTCPDLSPYHQRVLADLAANSAFNITAVHAPNPLVHRYSGLDAKAVNRIFPDDAKAANVKKLRFDDPEYGTFCSNTLVLAQVSDPDTGYCILGVTLAPPTASVTDIAHFHPIPVHLLARVLPKDALVSGKKCDALLLHDATHMDARIGGCQLAGVALDWIKYDPRYIVDKWVTRCYTAAHTSSVPGADAEDEEEEAEEEEAEEEKLVVKKKARPSKKATTAAAKEPEEPDEPATDRLDAARQVLISEGPFPKSTVQHAFEERKNPGFFPATFSIDIAQISALNERIELATDDDESSSSDTIELIKCLIVSEQWEDLLGLGFMRWFRGAGSPAHTTAAVDDLVKTIRADKGVTRTQVLQLIAETRMVATFLRYGYSKIVPLVLIIRPQDLARAPASFV